MSDRTELKYYTVIGFDDGENLHPVGAAEAHPKTAEVGLNSDTDWLITVRARSVGEALEKVQEWVEDGSLRRTLLKLDRMER